MPRPTATTRNPGERLIDKAVHRANVAGAGSGNSAGGGGSASRQRRGTGISHLPPEMPVEADPTTGEDITVMLWDSGDLWDSGVVWG